MRVNVNCLPTCKAVLHAEHSDFLYVRLSIALATPHLIDCEDLSIHLLYLSQFPKEVPARESWLSTNFLLAGSMRCSVRCRKHLHRLLRRALTRTST